MKGQWVRRPQNGCVVVFVHGLFSTSVSAWRSKTAYWPDLVSDEPALAEYGIYLFGYETALASGNYSLADASDALNEYLKLDGFGELRQINFVAHSMGGIIARHFIVSRRELFIEKHVSVGLLLVASPSLGSDYANLLSNLGIIHNVQVDSLRFAQDNV